MLEKWHPQTQHNIVVRQTKDIFVLVIIQEKNRQICQVRADLFGEVPNQASMDINSPVMQAALDFYRPLVEQYCNDTLRDKFELQQAKDQKLIDLGLKRSWKQRVMKNPAISIDDKVDDDNDDRGDGDTNSYGCTTTATNAITATGAALSHTHTHTQ